MKHLIALTAVRLGSTWYKPGEAVPGDVLGFDYEKAARKGMLEDEDGDDIVNPTADPVADASASATGEDAAQLDDLLEANQSLKADLDAQRQEVQRLSKLVGDGDTERAGQRQDIERLAAELRSARSNLENTQQAHDDYRAEMEGRVATLSEERDAARKAFEEARTIPDDALSRLEGVSGIGKALAEKALAALAGK